MILVKETNELQDHLENLRKKGAMGFVPTMGALHLGHAELFRRCKKECDVVVGSIFVNPTQFGPNEDYKRYPRTLDRDVALLEELGVDLLFAPSRETMYAGHPSFSIVENQISQPLCGKSRPGHFSGVATVVMKLLNLTSPKKAFFGQKDAQQLRLIEKLCSEFFLPIEIVSVPTVREKDGLALSSRNQYLSASERELAPLLFKALTKGRDCFEKGIRETKQIENAALELLQEVSTLQLDYLEVRTWSDFSHPPQIEEKSILAVAAYLGKTRLIDNLFLVP